MFTASNGECTTNMVNVLVHWRVVTQKNGIYSELSTVIGHSPVLTNRLVILHT
jgi:hypothetical protein